MDTVKFPTLAELFPSPTGINSDSVYFKDGDWYDKCIVCWGPTNVRTSTPLFARENYVSGAGQCCSRCFWEVGASAED